MRPDMAQVIIERPRKGGGIAKGRFKNTSFEDLPQNESMKRPHIGCEKELNENLKPLERFLMKNSNRPWDKVYSEICENIRLTNTVQRHVLEHLNWMIEKKTFIGKDGKIWYYANFSDNNEHPISECFSKFYICPKTKLLRFNKEKRVKKYRAADRKPDLCRHKVTLKEQYAKLGGIWYAVEFHAYYVDKYQKYVHDEVMAGLQRANEQQSSVYLGGKLYSTKSPKDFFWAKHQPELVNQFWGTKGLRAVKGKQLSGKELKKLGLRNDGQEA